jgi:hypothetical protein
MNWYLERQHDALWDVKDDDAPEDMKSVDDVKKKDTTKGPRHRLRLVRLFV